MIWIPATAGQLAPPGPGVPGHYGLATIISVPTFSDWSNVITRSNAAAASSSTPPSLPAPLIVSNAAGVGTADFPGIYNLDPAWGISDTMFVSPFSASVLPQIWFQIALGFIDPAIPDPLGAGLNFDNAFLGANFYLSVADSSGNLLALADLTGFFGASLGPTNIIGRAGVLRLTPAVLAGAPAPPWLIRLANVNLNMDAANPWPGPAQQWQMSVSILGMAINSSFADGFVDAGPSPPSSSMPIPIIAATSGFASQCFPFPS